MRGGHAIETDGATSLTAVRLVASVRGVCLSGVTVVVCVLAAILLT
jgi:hypothetical protein